jgi:hypothetical protein
MSPRYLGDLRVRLGRFVQSFGEGVIAGINASRIDQWLRGLGVGAVTRNTFRRRLAVLFSFAKRRGYVTENPIADAERAKVKVEDRESPPGHNSAEFTRMACALSHVRRACMPCEFAKKD